jgi:uracil-DNA glycosylase
MSGADPEQEVYYEDLISPPTKPKQPTTGPEVKGTEIKAITAGVSAPANVPAQENAISNPLKRQRTIVDMFGGSSAKKTKVDGPSSTIVSKNKTLNTIPFNMNEFINSLTGEQRGLLGLEVETIGKSWSVSTSPPRLRNTVSILHPTIPPIIIHPLPAANLLHTAQAKAPA